MLCQMLDNISKTNWLNQKLAQLYFPLHNKSKVGPGSMADLVETDLTVLQDLPYQHLDFVIRGCQVVVGATKSTSCTKAKG